MLESEDIPKRLTKRFYVQDRLNKYSKCMAVFVGICHLICGISCLVIRSELYNIMRANFHSYEIIFLIIISFYVSGFCFIQSALKSNLFWIISSLICSVNSLIGAIILDICTIEFYEQMIVVYGLRDYDYETHLSQTFVVFCFVAYTIFIIIEIIASILGFILCVRCICCGQINTAIVRVNEGEKIKISGHVEAI